MNELKVINLRNRNIIKNSSFKSLNNIIKLIMTIRTILTEPNKILRQVSKTS